MTSKIITYEPPSYIADSSAFSVWVNDRKLFVYQCQVADYTTFSFEGKVNIRIETTKSVDETLIRPLSYGIKPLLKDNIVEFTINQAQNLSIEVPGLPQLFLFANPLEEDVPEPEDPNVMYFKGGQVYDVERLELSSGQILYIEGGAILKGCIHSIFTENITVRGRGIIDASYMPYHKCRMLVFEKCKDLKLEGIITIGTPAWNLVLGCCDNVHIDNIKLIGWVVCSDGIDVVGSHNVLIENCFLRCNDDCVVVKSVSYHDTENDSQTDWRRNVNNIVVQKSVMYNDKAGNVMEIGFETQADKIENIIFRDIDVIGAHGEGGVFTIHNGDRAVISNIVYEDIRVEHYYDKLVDIRIMFSRYSKDMERGKVKNIHFKNIQTVEDRFNCISFAGGFDSEHNIEGITFENFRIGDKKINSEDDLNMYCKYAKDIKFK